jgi:CRISPR/Cas system CSM-associated protein Csm3 (group 7 of RAMP superfamily)
MNVERLRAKVEVEARSDLLVGGQADAPAFLDQATARDDAGNPIIPASSLKGALREAIVKLVNGRREAGTTAEPIPCSPWDPCKDRGCAVCRILGAPGPDRPGFRQLAPQQDPGTARFSIEDAVLEEHRAERFAVRHGVSVDRKTGHAASGRLFQRQVATVRGAVFSARLEAWLSPDDARLLEEACKLVDGVGNSRTRGWGLVAVRLVRDDARPASSASVSRSEASEWVVTLRAETDLHLGSIREHGNVRTGMDTVPGSAVLAAVVWALVRSGVAEEQVSRFAEQLRFSDLLPAREKRGELVSAAPRTLLACRKHPQQAVDVVLRSALAPRLLRDGGAPTAALRCPFCNDPLRPTRRWIAANTGDVADSASTRVVTRLAMDPRSGSHAPGMLHLCEQVQAGSEFVGTVSGMDRAMAATIGKLTEPLRVGGMRGRGLGRVTLAFDPYDSTNLRTRLESFASRAGKVVTSEVAGAMGLPTGTWVEAVVRTPLALPDGTTLAGVADWLAKELFPSRDVSFSCGFHRDALRGGWDEKRGRPRPLLPVLQPGSVWLFQLKGAAFPDLAPLVRAETVGVGPDEQTRLGLGRFCFCPKLDLLPREKELRNA